MARIKNVRGEAFKAKGTLDMIFPSATPGRVRARGENHGWLTETKDRPWGISEAKKRQKTVQWLGSTLHGKYKCAHEIRSRPIHLGSPQNFFGINLETVLCCLELTGAMHRQTPESSEKAYSSEGNRFAEALV